MKDKLICDLEGCELLLQRAWRAFQPNITNENNTGSSNKQIGTGEIMQLFGFL